MAVSPVDIISPAFERMKRQLFPFNFWQWLRIAITGLLAGEFGYQGGFGLNFPFNLPSRSNGFQAGPLAGLGALFVIGIVLLAVLALVFAVVMLYISSRMRFVLFDTVISGDCRIGEYWRRNGGPAMRYFVWQIVISVSAIAGVAAIVGVPLLLAFMLGFLPNARLHVVPLVVGGALMALLLMIWIVGIILLHVLTKDFVVPQMALEGISAFEGWRRLLRLMENEKGRFAGYAGLKLVLSIAAAIVIGIAVVFSLIILAIPFGAVGLVAVLLGKTAGLGWNPLTIAIAVVFACILLAVIVLAILLIAVPAVIFFPNYAFLFFADRYPPLQAALSPPAS